VGGPLPSAGRQVARISFREGTCWRAAGAPARHSSQQEPGAHDRLPHASTPLPGLLRPRCRRPVMMQSTAENRDVEVGSPGCRAPASGRRLLLSMRVLRSDCCPVSIAASTPQAQAGVAAGRIHGHFHHLPACLPACCQQRRSCPGLRLASAAAPPGARGRAGERSTQITAGSTHQGRQNTAAEPCTLHSMLPHLLQRAVTAATVTSPAWLPRSCRGARPRKTTARHSRLQ